MKHERLGKVLARWAVTVFCLAVVAMPVWAQGALGDDAGQAHSGAPGSEAGAAAGTAADLRTPVGELFGPVPLFSVSDGDTLVVMSNVGPRVVRLIGIDAPELGQPGSREAQAALVELLSPGVFLWLELDLGIEDMYGRLLAYVYVPDAAGVWEHAGMRLTQVNLAMLTAGWAHAEVFEPNETYADLHELATDRARDSQVGLWAVGTQGSNGARGETGGHEAAGLDGSAAEAVASGDDPVDDPVDDPFGDPFGDPVDDALALGASSSTGVSDGNSAPPIRIHCGLLNPVADNDVGEWVSVYLTEPHDTRGYYLFDVGSRSMFRLPNGMQPAGELRVYNPGQGVWNNSGDTVYLMRGGAVVDRWEYQAHEAVSGAVVCRSN